MTIELRDLDGNRELFRLLKQKLHPGLLGSFKGGLDTAKAAALKHLVLHLDSLENLELLQYFPRLETLELASARLGDLRGLRHCPGLRELSLVRADLARIRWEDILLCRDLQDLQLYFSQECSVDLAFLNKLPKLAVLHLEYEGWAALRLRSFDQLGQLPALQTLSLVNLPVGDLSWLAGNQQLCSLHLEGLPLRDLTPLATLPRLSSLTLCLADMTAGQRAEIEQLLAHVEDLRLG